MLLNNIDQAIEILNNDGLIIYPTETFFGLGCKFSSEKAISKIFKAKKRLLAMPLPVIIADLTQINLITSLSGSLYEDVLSLAEKFWPGPLSLILPARVTVSPLLTGGTGKIAVRQSSHPIAVELAKRIGEPLISSSANLSGTPPSTKVVDMDLDFLDKIDAILNMDPEPKGGLASTIIEPKGNKTFSLLREGAIASSEIISFGFNPIV